MAAAAANQTYLDNGHIRLGLDLDMGGAISYLAKSRGGSNLINDWDHGRQVQLSFYAGPTPFQPPGTTLDPAWKALGWNPIQAGDAFGHGSKITRCQNNGKSIRLRCVPLIWPLNNVPAECAFEVNYTLAGNTVEVACRLLNDRSDHTQYPARMQELPAVYSNGPWYKLVSYLGTEPFANAATTTLVDLSDGKGWPWLNFYAPEHWTALVNKDNQGLGVFEPDCCEFSGGFAGQPKGIGGAHNDQTGYIAPNLREILDCNISYKFQYVLIVGSLAEIRNYACRHSKPAPAPHWTFKSDRQHWSYENTTDTGWPIKRELVIGMGNTNSAFLSPPTFWLAQNAPIFEMDASFTAGQEVSLMVEQANNPNAWFGPIHIPITADGKYRRYRVSLADNAGYNGPMQQVKVLLPESQGTAKFRSIGFQK